jgi:ABC-2 type transport system permease protein
MGGLFTSTESMPGWARAISMANPVTYLIEVMRMVILKGSGVADILRHLGVVAMFAVIFNGWAIVNYKKTS